MYSYPQIPSCSKTIPSTPGPKPISEIKSNATDRFAGLILIQKDPNRSVEDYFIDYDHWEIYSEDKSYSKRSYQAAHKGIMKEYYNYLCILSEEEMETYYVVAKRVRNELELLEPFCTCTNCSSYFLKHLWCSHCVRCIKSGSGFANPEYITKAKKLKDLSKKDTIIPYFQKLNNLPSIKKIEIILVVVLLLFIFNKLLN